MKKTFLPLVALLSTSVMAQTQMHIHMKNGSTIDYEVNDIEKVTWSSASAEDLHEYVDLGLSVNWATCNVGATSPEDYGDYFAWGETEPKTTYDWSTYKLCYGSYGMLTKYCMWSIYGTVDNKTTLEPMDDAAHVNWGGAWRMPTKAEQDELREKCTWEWTMLNGVEGYKVKGPSGNSIFLPAAGYRHEEDLDFDGIYGQFWSSSLDTTYSTDACGFYFFSEGFDGNSDSRCYGLSVRPVCK